MKPKVSNNLIKIEYKTGVSYCAVVLILIFSIPETLSYPSASDSGSNAAEDGQFSWIGLTILSVSSLLVLITVLFACGAGNCCGLSKIHWFGRSAREEGPMSFENPVAAGTMMMQGFSQIDASALDIDRDRVRFEPLPTISNLAPLVNPNHQYANEAAAGENRIPTGQMHQIPFATEDVELYAHDWFDEPHKNFPRLHLNYIQEIGKSWFGQVLEAEANDIVPYARRIKVLVKQLREDASQIEQMRFLDEARLYRDANHGNILKLLGQSIEKLPFLLIMEQYPQGDLKSYLIGNVTRAEILSKQGSLLRMALDIAKGLEWMQRNEFKHHDLAARNCQVASEGRIVIGDYGLATQNFKDDYYWNSNIPIPLRWAAPETIHCTVSTIQTLKVTTQANIWTFAVVLWEILEFGKLPYFEMSDEEVITRVLADKNYVLGQPTLPYIPLKEELYGIMRSCWTSDPQKRPSMTTVVSKIEQLLNDLAVFKSPPSNEEFESKWDQIGSAEDKLTPRKKSVSFMGIQKLLKEAEGHESSETGSIGGEDIEKNRASSLQSDQNQSASLFGNTSLSDQSGISSLAVPEISVLPATPGTTPNRTCIDINVIEASPLPPMTPSPTPVQATEDQAEKRKVNFVFPGIDTPSPNLTQSKPSTPVSNGRHTSTPKRSSSSPMPSESAALGEDDVDVFDGAEDLSLNFTAKFSPIKKVMRNGVSSGDLVSTVLVGASDELSLDIFQGVTSQIEETIEESESTEYDSYMGETQISVTREEGLTSQEGISMNEGNADPDFRDYEEELEESAVLSQTPVHLHFGPGIQILSKNNEGVMSLTPRPPPPSDLHQRRIIKGRRLFADSSPEVSVNSEYSTTETTAEESRLESTVLNDNPSDCQVVQTRLEGSGSSAYEIISDPESLVRSNGSSFVNVSLPERESPSFDNVSVPEGGSSYSVISSEEAGVTTNGNSSPAREEQEDVANGEFWSRQLQSVHDAASNTRSLFELSLNGFDGADSSDKFVEDIQAANEELGSLVLHDLEDSSGSSQMIVPETPINRDSHGVSNSSPEKKTKLAFWCDSSCSVVEDSEQASSTSVDNSAEIVDWGLNCSVEVKKSQDIKIHNNNEYSSSRLGVGVVRNDETGDESDDGEEAGVKCKEFVLSKWNVNLTPSRPAIKSPSATTVTESQDAQPKSNLKKSVSFERKKNQLIYSYPPPPPDSSEEDLRLGRTINFNPTAIPLQSTLDWDLTQEELEDAVVHQDDSDEDEIVQRDPMNMYRISDFGNDDESFQVRGSSEPFVFQPSTLGELRHTRDRLTLDLNKGEASLLDEETSKSGGGVGTKLLDSGVGSSTNPSPSNPCDITALPRSSNNLVKKP